jgi:predicted Zn-dependent protease
LLRERELQQIIETVLHLAKKIGVPETEVHVDEAADALTRFANNAIHQNVAEHGLTVSVRTVFEGRTARATTNRIDEDSLRNAIEGSLSLAASQPKNPLLLPMPGAQKYSRVHRFVKQTAAVTPEDRALAVRRACDLAIKKGQIAAGIFATGQSQTRWKFARAVRGHSETHGIFHYYAESRRRAG